MLARLRENFIYKILALACAFLLHVYVTAEQNPQQSRPLVVRLSPRNVPAGTLVDSASVPVITITVDGPAEDVKMLADSSIGAFVDLTHGIVGKNALLPVRTDIPLTLRGVVSITDVQPHEVSLVLKPRKKRRLPVIPDFPGTLPAGYSYQVPTILPTEATVAGAEDSVNSVAHLAVHIDSEGAAEPIDDDYPIIPLDIRGNVVNDVAVTPSTVHVEIGIAKVPAMKALFISPHLVGTPPFAYTVADVQVIPPTIIVAGKADHLAQVGTIVTEPIDVSGATADLAKQVVCMPPAGLSIPTPTPITVKIRIVPRDTASPPPSTPQKQDSLTPMPPSVPGGASQNTTTAPAPRSP